MSDRVTARGKLGGRDIEAVAVNPGGWFGKTWLIEAGCGISSSFFAVEAGSVSDAIDEFVEWEEENSTTHARIDEDDESLLGDYGFEVHPGDIVGGVEVEKKGWVTLAGEFIPEGDPRGQTLAEPYVSGQGVHADLENVLVHGDEAGASTRGDSIPWACRYHHPSFGHTPEGIDPRDWGLVDESML